MSGFPSVSFNSQTGCSLPVDLYLRVGDFLPKLSGRAYNAMKHPWRIAEGAGSGLVHETSPDSTVL